MQQGVQARLLRPLADQENLGTFEADYSEQMELEIYSAFVDAGVAPDKAKAELKTELIKAIADSQRWTVTAIFAAVGIFAALTKFLH